VDENGRYDPTVVAFLFNEIALLRWNVKVLGAALAKTQLLGQYDALQPVAAPMPAGRTSRLCRQSDMDSDWIRYWWQQLHVVGHYHRKYWEWGFVLQALWEAGMLTDGKSGLAFAVGQEPLPALLTARGVRVLATDLDSADDRSSAWEASNQHSSSLEALYFPYLVSRERFESHCAFRFVDMNTIPSDLHGSFDFCWSACAAEHVGSIDLCLKYLENSVRCLKPGGVAVHTLEFNLDTTGATRDHASTVLPRRENIKALEDRLHARGHSLLAVDFSTGDGPLDGFVDPHPYDLPKSAFMAYPAVPHLRLSVDQFPATSLGLIIRANTHAVGAAGRA
jgi:SAM-dependent methyltransferase